MSKDSIYYEPWLPAVEADEERIAYNVRRHELKREALAKGDVDQERLENMSPEEIKAEWQAKTAEEEAAKRPQKEYWTARTFLAERPDFVTGPKNAQRMEVYMQAAGLDTTNVDDVHKAAKALEARGLLDLDLSKIEVKPRTRLTEDDLYSMPLEELEKLTGRR